MIPLIMDGRQMHISEFVANFSGKKKSATSDRPSSTSEIIIFDGSDDSDSEKVDTMEAITCPSITTNIPARRLDEDVKNEEQIQLVPQVSVVTHQLTEHLSDETVLQVDLPSSSILVGTPEVSVSIAKVTASNSATVCSISDNCDCVGCSDLTRRNHPLNVAKST